MLRVAAFGAGHIYGQMKNYNHPLVQQSSIEAYAALAADVVGALNIGAVTQLTQSPSDTTSTCYVSAEATNALIVDMADFAQYTTGGFDPATFTQKFQLMNIKLMKEFEDCGVIPLLVKLDTMINDLPQTVSAVTNLGTQVATGIASGSYDSSVFLATNKIQAGA